MQKIHFNQTGFMREQHTVKHITSDGGEGLCHEAEDIYAPTREHSRSNDEVKTWIPRKYQAVFQIKGGKIEKSYLLFQTVSITHKRVPCPFPRALYMRSGTGDLNTIKEPLEQWTELFRTDCREIKAHGSCKATVNGPSQLSARVPLSSILLT